MGRHLSIVLLGLVLLPSLESVARAQTSGEVLVFFPSARAYGMGQVGVADAYDPANAHLNPSIIAANKELFLSASGGKLVPDLFDDVYNVIVSMGAAFQLLSSPDGIGLRAGGGLGFGYLDLGETEVRDIDNNYLGKFSGSEKYVDLTLGGEVTLAHSFSFSAGLAVKPLWIDRVVPTSVEGKYDGNGIAMDIGLMARAELSNLYQDARIIPSIGWSVKNLGSDISFKNLDQEVALPSEHCVGIGLRLESPSIKGVNEMLGTRIPIGTVVFGCDAIDDRLIKGDFTGFENWRVGAELGLLQALFLRCGYVNQEAGNIKDFTYGVGIGIKFHMLRGRVDYARVPQARELQMVNKFGASFGVAF